MHLDWREKQQVRYAVPHWLRDEQIRKNTASIVGRIQPGERKADRCAIVGYGPSLRDTWEQLRGFEVLFTCSGAHKFLLERGIVPTYHVEVDPRDHKIGLLGDADPRVTYLPASTCHPDYVAHIQRSGAPIQLWHIFDTAAESQRVLPPGEWALTGGCDAGLRAMVIAAFLGYRDLHVFGLDGSVPEGETGRHAGPHPNTPTKYASTEYEGKTYWTTAGMLEAARSVVHELEQMPVVTATFYGDGLVQAMAQKYRPKPATEADMVRLIGVHRPMLITPEYVAQNRQLHEANPAYGVGGERHLDTVLKLCDGIKSRNVLDYGCGKGRLGAALPFGICEYDPAIPGKDVSPRPADLVVCTDVLEHIEPDHLHAVLADLRRCVLKVGYFVIHTGPASKTLPDGRNTHLIQRGEEWWRKNLARFFEVGAIRKHGPELHVVVGPKQKAKAA